MLWVTISDQLTPSELSSKVPVNGTVESTPLNDDVALGPAGLVGKVSHLSGHRKGNLVAGRGYYVASDVDGVGPVDTYLTLVILCQPTVG
jgi:hypothetical protein